MFFFFLKGDRLPYSSIISPVTQVWNLKENHPPENLLVSIIPQLTVESTDARLLGARHVSLNNYCFLKATVKKYSIEDWKEIVFLNACRAECT